MIVSFYERDPFPSSDPHLTAILYDINALLLQRRIIPIGSIRYLMARFDRERQTLLERCNLNGMLHFQETGEDKLLYVDPRIEQSKPEHAEGIAKMLCAAWLDTYPNQEYGISQEDITKHLFTNVVGEDNFSLRRSFIIEDGKRTDRINLAAVVDRQVVGTIRVFMGDPNALRMIYVDPRYYRRGIGRKLYQKALSLLTNTNDIKVNVVEYNARAIAFYKSLGYVDTGQRFKRYELQLPEMEMLLKRGKNETLFQSCHPSCAISHAEAKERGLV